MKNLIFFINISLSTLIVILILLQGKGAGLGSAWGGGGEMYQTRRGMEKFTFRLTITLIIIFFLLSLINLLFIK